MVSLRYLFLQHVAQTSPAPLSIEIERAQGIYLYGPDKKEYIDLISGVSVSNVGHCLPQVVKAVQEQAAKYMHLMVYGEILQSPQIQFAQALCSYLPLSLQNVYFVNSGSEATEGAIKLAKRFTGKHKIVAFKNAYHGSTQGALSVLGNESMKNAFRPLIPGVVFIDFDDSSQLSEIDSDTACVIVEPIQAEAGIILPADGYLEKLREQCTQNGALLIFDEVQTGFGRTGTLFAFQKYDLVPDIITIAKGMGGGMPLGAFVASKELMDCLTCNPILGHITTFGGHPVSCAAALASLRYLIDNKIVEEVKAKETLFKKMLVHPSIKEVRGLGLLLAMELGNANNLDRFLKLALEDGLILDFFLFCNTAVRIAPPLIITEKEILYVCNKIILLLDKLKQETERQTVL